GWVLVFAVVVASDRAGANVSAFTDRGVTEISQMHRFRAATESRFLDLYEIPDDGSLFHPRIHPQVRERADRAIIGDLRSQDEAMILHRHSVAKFRINNARA